MISAETVANNLDLLTEILLRLPTKPLLTFKCVSKQWLSLISNSKFCLSHTRHHHCQNPTPTALLLNKIYTPTPKFKILPLKHKDTICNIPFLDYLNIPGITKIFQSCNGLLLCSSKLPKRKRERDISNVHEISSSVVTDEEYSERYFICNPTTKQFKYLPIPNLKFYFHAYKFSLAYDPLKSIHYKVIAFLELKSQTNERGENQCQIYIYSSETNSWSPTEITVIPPWGLGLYARVFCNGAIHWDSQEVNSLYFDVDRECLKTMPMPPFSDGRNYRRIRYFGESGGHLHLIVKDIDFTLEFNILKMRPDYSGWFVKYHVNLYALRIVFPQLFWNGEEEYRNVFSVLCVIRAEKEEETMAVVYLNGRAISYNVYNGTSKELCKLQSKSKALVTGLDYEGHDAYQYFETLSCV